MVRSNYAKAQSRGRFICALLAIVCALALCVTGVSMTAFAHNETQVELEQWVDGNGFRITYVAQGINRTKQLLQEEKYDDEIPGLYSRIKFENIVGVDNWGKPIDFSKRFRVHISSEQAQDWYVIDIASSTSAANVNAVQGHLTIGGPEAANQIEQDSIVHFLNMQENKITPSESENNVRIDTARKGLATDNTKGDIPVGYLNEDGSYREYIYTFDFVSGNDESERSTLTASTNADDEPDVFYLTDTQKTLEGKRGYFSLFANGKAGWYTVKLVQENNLAINVGDNTVEKILINDDEITVSDTVKVFGGDIVKMKLSDSSAVLKIDNNAVIADSNGYYTFYMPDNDTTVSVEENAGTYYLIEYVVNGGSYVIPQTVAANATPVAPHNPTRIKWDFVNWYEDSDLAQVYEFNAPLTENITLYAKWTTLHTVTYKINGFEDYSVQIVDLQKTAERTIADDICPASGDRANGWKADNLSLTWYADADFETEFDFDSAITEETVLYGKLVETKQYKNTGAYGWDELTNFTDDSGTEIIQSAFYATPFDIDDDGTAVFMMTAQQEAIFSRALDVTKDIYLNVSLNAANGAWFIMSLWDKLTLAQIAYSDNYQHSYGIKTAFGLNTESGAILPVDCDFGSTGALPDAVDGGEFFKYTISENEGESAIYVLRDDEWTKLATMPVTQSDFQDGKAYFSMATFLACEANVKIWQEFDATTENDGNGTVTVDVIGGGSALKITTAANEGYTLDTLTVNGKAVTLNNKGLCVFDDYTEFADGANVKATFKSASSSGGDSEKPGEEENKGEEGGDEGCGCGSIAGGFGAMGAAAAVLIGAGAMLVIRRKKAND